MKVYRAEPPDEENPVDRDGDGLDDEKTLRYRLNRIFTALIIIMIAIVWSILNSTIWASKTGHVAVTHGPIDLPIRSLQSMRVRPILLTHDTLSPVTALTVAFENDAVLPRPVLLRDLRFVIGGRAAPQLNAPNDPAQRIVLRRRGHTVVTVRFGHGLAPGATLVYTPQWAGGRSLRWPVWR